MTNSVVRHRIANSNLLEYASENRNEGFFNDLTIITGNENIPANRLVLSCHSKYFEGMFKSSLLKHESAIEIRAVDETTMKALIDFIYHGSITVNDDNVMTLLSGAEYLQLNEVKQFCFEYLEKYQIVLDNSLDVFKMISKSESSGLQNKIKKYISVNLNRISQTEKFKVLTKQNLISCISALDRLHANEASVYQAVVTWTRHNEETRVTEFPELFKMINLENMTVDFIEKSILEEDLVLTNPQCRKQALTAYRHVVRKEKSEPSESHLISLGGERTGKKVTVVFSLSQTPKAYPNFDVEIYSYCTLKLNDCIYTIGGSRKDRERVRSNSVRKLKHFFSNEFPLEYNVVVKLNLKKTNGE